MEKETELIINGENEILGRVAAYAAKQALQGKKVVILNCEKILISGNKTTILNKYLARRKRGPVRFPSVPERIVKRAVRGMINYKSGRGIVAFKRMRCYNNTPEQYQKVDAIKLGNKNLDLMNVKDLGRLLKEGRK